MSLRPITDDELRTLDFMVKQGDLELSNKEIKYRNARYAQTIPLLLEKIAALRARLERAEADTRRLDSVEAMKAPSISQIGNHEWQVFDSGVAHRSPFLRDAIDKAINSSR